MSASDQDNRIGVLGATSYVVGNIIGSGIFVTPAGILHKTNSVGLSLIIWVLSGLVTLLGAFCYMELGTSIRESGADFAYICYVKWYPVAFAFMWVSVILTYPASAAVGIETFGEYVLTALSPVVCIQPEYRAIAKKLCGFLMICRVLTYFFRLPFFSRAADICELAITETLCESSTNTVYGSKSSCDGNHNRCRVLLPRFPWGYQQLF